MKKSPGIYWSLTVSLFCFCSPALAEEAVEDFFSMSPAELAEINVTIATGTSKSVAESAAVTTVITADQIKTMGATELHEVLETVPGLHASLQEVTYDYHYSLRGIRNTTNSQVLMLMNGARFNLPFRSSPLVGLQLPIDNIQRIEIIRGPGSALYGADAFAGVINIITKKAKDIDGTRVAGRVGNWNSQSGWLQHGSRVGSWDIAASLQYLHSHGDDGRVIHSDAQSALDAAFGTHASHAPGPMNTQGETWNAHANLQRKHWDIDFWANESTQGTKAGVAASLDPKGSGNAVQYLTDIKFSTEDWFEDWEFLAQASFLYADFEADFQVFPDGAILPIGSDGSISFANPASLVLFPNGANQVLGREQKMPSFELSSIYQGFHGHRLRFAAGYRYEEMAVRDRKNFGVGVIDGSVPVVDGRLTDLTGTPLSSLADRQRSIWSFALQDEWRLAAGWQLTGGVRLDSYSDFGETINPRLALVWTVNDRLTNKLLYGRAFRAPSFSEQGNRNNPVLLGNPGLDPEIINTVELAFDYRPFDSVRTVLNLYHYRIEALIESVPDANGITSTFQNSGNQNGYGTEFEWNWQIHEQWLLKGNYAWQYALNERIDRRVNGVPEHQIYVASRWQFLPKWFLQSQLNWVGSRSHAAGDPRALKDYETVDMTLGGKNLYGHIDLMASVRNVFDADRREPSVVQLPGQLPLPGRSFYLEAAFHF